MTIKDFLKVAVDTDEFTVIYGDAISTMHSDLLFLFDEKMEIINIGIDLSNEKLSIELEVRQDV